MFHEAADHHKKAAAQHERAAYHHQEAARQHEAGYHEKAAYHARLAHDHTAQAVHHASEGASSANGVLRNMNAMKPRRGAARCCSCELSFLKINLTSRGQCLPCAQANKPRKVERSLVPS